MNEIIKELVKPSWWFSVVVAGIAINLLSSSLKAHLDQSLSTTSVWWRHRSVARKAAWDKYVNLLCTSAEERAHTRHLETRARLQAVGFLVMSATMITLGTSLRLLFPDVSKWPVVAMLGFGNIILFFAYLAMRDAVQRGKALSAARVNS